MPKFNIDNKIKDMKGEKVVCIDNHGGEYPLVIGRIYTVEDVSYNGDGMVVFSIINDNSTRSTYLIKRFELLSNIREEKLNKILKI